MNLAALENPENTYSARMRSMHDWWNLAGVDLHYNSEPTTLLSDVKTRSEPTEKAPQPIRVETSASMESNFQPEQKAAHYTDASENYPEQYDEFLDWLSTPDNLLETKWSRQFVLPIGVLEPEIMIITAMPDQEGMVRNSLFSEKCATLLTNILKAIGCDSAKTYSASISLARSFDGRIDPQYQDELRKRMIHLIGLVRPKRLVLFGETTSHLFFNENLLTARKNLQFINHFSSKTEAITTFHPRILNERSEFKAEAWKDLQLLSRVSGL